MSGINGKQGPLIAVGIFVTSCTVGAFFAFFIKEELRRLRPNSPPTVASSKDFGYNSQSISNIKDESTVSMLPSNYHGNEDQ